MYPNVYNIHSSAGSKKLDTEMFQSIENKQHVCACLGFTRTLASRMVLEVVSELNDEEYLLMQDVIQSCLLIKYTYEFLPSDTFCIISNFLVFIISNKCLRVKKLKQRTNTKIS